MKTSLELYLQKGLSYSWSLTIACRESTHQAKAQMQKEILATWCLAHNRHPYLTKEDLELLRRQTSMNKRQITNWVSNWRRRHWETKNKENKISIIQERVREDESVGTDPPPVSPLQFFDKQSTKAESGLVTPPPLPLPGPPCKPSYQILLPEHQPSAQVWVPPPGPVQSLPFQSTNLELPEDLCELFGFGH